MHACLALYLTPKPTISNYNFTNRQDPKAKLHTYRLVLNIALCYRKSIIYMGNHSDNTLKLQQLRSMPGRGLSVLNKVSLSHPV